jgi:probable HAF family extracellular repeat protein
MHDLGTLGGSDSYALAVNRAGLVVGRSRTVSGAYHPFLWDGTMHNLGSLGGNDSYAYDINDAGVVVGFGRTASNNWHAFVWDGTVRDLGTLGGGYSFAWAINDAGQIAGSALTASSGERAFLWDGTMHNLGTLGGAYSSPGGGSLWDLRMPGTKSINNAGQVVGRSRTASGGYHPFLWDGTMHDLGTLGGDDSRAMAINDAGQAVGSSMLASGESHATLWRILTPVEQVQAIIDLIESMNVDVSTSLIAKLNVVTAMLNDGRTGSAVRLLDAFISHVEGLRGNKLTSGQADQLQALAQAALDQLSA